MRLRGYFTAISFALCGAAAGGCAWPPPILPENASAPPAPRSLAMQLDGAALFDESGIDDTQWLQVDGAAFINGDPAAGAVGAYLSKNESLNGGLVIIIPGASTYEAGGVTAQARKTHREQGVFLRDAGYRTLTVARRECGTAYGGAEVDDTRAILDWLNAGGAAALNVERVYVYGYSTGATAVTVLNRQGAFAAGAALSGLTTPQDLFARRDFLEWIAGLQATNAGLCHLGSTFALYGDELAPEWDVLNVLDHIGELKSPQIFVHGDDDIVFRPRNLRLLRERYQQQRAAHAEWVELEFIEAREATHFSAPDDPKIRAAVLDFFARH